MNGRRSGLGPLRAAQKLTVRRSDGFRTLEATEIALYHALGALPEPSGTHRFC